MDRRTGAKKSAAQTTPTARAPPSVAVLRWGWRSKAASLVRYLLDVE
jgi:hypothetical protein